MYIIVGLKIIVGLTVTPFKSRFHVTEHQITQSVLGGVVESSGTEVYVYIGVHTGQTILIPHYEFIRIRKIPNY